MADITAIVLTKNEEQNIVRCLESVKDLCSRVCVVDSGSTDRTVELAKAHGADVYFHEFEPASLTGALTTAPLTPSG